MILNRDEVVTATQTVPRDRFPNLAAAVDTLGNLVEWTDDNSDGWPYWRKPSNASDKLQGLVKAHLSWHGIDTDEDATAAEVRKALAPIKAFLTRQGVSHATIIVNPEA